MKITAKIQIQVNSKHIDISKIFSELRSLLHCTVKSVLPMLSFIVCVLGVIGITSLILLSAIFLTDDVTIRRLDIFISLIFAIYASKKARAMRKHYLENY